MTEPLLQPPPILRIDHNNAILLLGSCFSEHIGKRLRRVGFNVLSNPYGTIFHPVPLSVCLERLWNQPERWLQNEDVWLSYDCSSDIYGLSLEALVNRINAADHLLKQHIEQTKTIIITFGSAHGYRLKQDNLLVANCHKQPQELFQKELTDVNVLVEVWKTLLKRLILIYPNRQIILTVSPVRYSRDGWVENNRSKARLLQLAEQLEKEFELVHYFPAYELVIDLLRDYRFFGSDGVHPNEQAIDAVWELFSASYFSDSTKSIVSEADQLRKMEEHRLLFPDSKQAEKFRQQLNKKRESFLSLNPFIEWF